MTNRFLISAAVAALIAGTGFANAQGTGMNREGASGGAATQQTAPSSGGAMNRDSGMKGAEFHQGLGVKGYEGIPIQRQDAGEQERAGHQVAAG